ncbi:hypothetical protein H8356DRAFT_1622888 [Neocallimastix lanati (nom. inval.)]|jgi:molecular chaperone DnaK (HSP70)|uniref:SH3 domain-containing protein n=1 Tax=Neocallimastix californiae TaxID=1754190 RepID=A0A1Y2AFR3_9FUNG|nr:hypothetical protein H8356DRAFT_1622888 [Neocallimastix sp. JGI-2020a]ORY21284.1 hypothetical protein LY90DRAFT_676355 [Neocallimastix californiae]|eukprot:ORY21284.1 hypothetical protein LY90DRAFT_676355 [Neocallimastix californiae]
MLKKSSQSKSSELDSVFIVAGIDFGTTCSGFAFANKKDLDKTTTPILNDYINWRDQPFPFPKTSTSILYDQEGNVKKWGWSADKYKSSHSGDYYVNKIKLYLDEELLPTLPNPRKFLPPGKIVVDVIADYLKKLLEVLMDELREKYGNDVSIENILFCLTVPAMWSDRAKHSMRVAAEKAGMVQSRYSQRLILVLEPEAAAYYIMNYSPRKIGLEPNDRLMVVDAGGGTADLIVHRLKRSGNLEEVCRGSGESCGSTFVDDEMYSWLKKKLGPVWKRMEKDNVSLMEYFNEPWQKIKLSFRGDMDDDSFDIPAKLSNTYMTSEDRARLNGGDEIVITESDVRSFFHNSVVKIKKLIRDLLDECGGKIEKCILVGGFGSSQYLLNCIKKDFGSCFDQILRTEEPGSAILKGAVLCGLDPFFIQARRCALSYGIEAIAKVSSWKLGIIPSKKKKPGLFIPIAEKGELIEASQYKEKGIFRPAKPNQTVLPIKIYSINERKAEFKRVHKDGFSYHGKICVNMPDVGRGIDRPVMVRMYLGQPDIKVVAINVNTGEEYSTTFNPFASLEDLQNNGSSQYNYSSSDSMDRTLISRSSHPNLHMASLRTELTQEKSLYTRASQPNLRHISQMSQGDSGYGNSIASNRNSRSNKVGMTRSGVTSYPGSGALVNNRSSDYQNQMLPSKRYSQQSNKSCSRHKEPEITCYKVAHKYEPQKADEMRLHVGDIVTVDQSWDDGWAYGKNLSSKDQGIFPLDYLIKLPPTSNYHYHHHSQNNSIQNNMNSANPNGSYIQSC